MDITRNLNPITIIYRTYTGTVRIINGNSIVMFPNIIVVCKLSVAIFITHAAAVSWHQLYKDKNPHMNHALRKRVFCMQCYFSLFWEGGRVHLDWEKLRLLIKIGKYIHLKIDNKSDFLTILYFLKLTYTAGFGDNWHVSNKNIKTLKITFLENFQLGNFRSHFEKYIL